ncbi:T9SS type A sorting domain-containing protein, partial [Flavobacteriaceae bacterium]|nr:T9SS type A sorting domain-containing protein [Flavobacteriaceae bacterium]
GDGGESQTITVSIDVSADPGGVNIVTPTVSGSWAEYPATVDPNDANKYSYTFADGVTSAEFVWKVYGTSAGDVQENLTSLVGGGAIENNLAATLPTGNGINTDYGSYCNRTVASDSGDFVAPTFIFNSFKQVGVTYTELVLTADAGDNIVIDYSLNGWDPNHGPGATDNGDGTYTAIVNPTSAFEYKWNNLTTSTQEDLLACANGNGINTDNSSYANRVHVAGEDEADTFGVCPETQTITVSIDVSADPGGVNIVTPTVSGSWAEYPATVDPNDANKYSYTFADGVTSAEFVWKVYGTSAGDVQENLTSLVGGGAIENNLAATLPTGNGINTDYGSYCNRTVASDSGDFVAPTFIFNSFKQVGVTYTELVLTADAGDNIVIDYSLNGWDPNHGPGATDNGDGTYTAIVNPTSAFEYKWNNLTTSTQEDLLACANGNGINTDNSSYANRVHVAGEDEADTFGVCPETAGVNDNSIINVSVYPNPSNSDWNFRTPNTVINSVEVFNLLGKRVASQRSNNNTEISISTQGLTSGIYIARITTEQGTKSVKLIKN